jgi:hypothetical protein
MCLVMRAYARMSRAAANEGSHVLQGMASLSISRVIEGCSGSSSSNCGFRSVSVTAASAAAVPPQDGYDAAVAGHTSAAATASGAPSQEPAQTAGGAAAAAAASQDNTSIGDGVAQIAAMDSQLQRYMRLRNIQTVCITIFLLDRLSKLQIAEAIVGELSVAVAPCNNVLSMFSAAGLSSQHFILPRD